MDFVVIEKLDSKKVDMQHRAYICSLTNKPVKYM